MKQVIDNKLYELEQRFLGGFEPTSRTLDYQRFEVPMRTRFSVNVRCEISSSYVSGNRGADSFDESDCDRKINEYKNECVNGQNFLVNNTLAKILRQDPLGASTRSIELDRVTHSYSCTCSRCRGAGQVSCSCNNGYVSCSSCGGMGSRSCGLCNGGYRWDGNRQVVCGSCSYGKVNCYVCSSSGRCRCGACAGSGKLDCVNCDATGYFTYTYTAVAYSQGSQSCAWNKDTAPAWMNKFIADSLQGVCHLDFNRAVPWVLPSAQFSFDTGLPYSAQLEGTLVGIQANIENGSHKTTASFLYPETLLPLHMGHFLDNSVAVALAQTQARATTEQLAVLCKTPLALSALERLTADSKPMGEVTHASMLSDGAFAKIKSALIDHAKRYESARKSVSVTRVLVNTAISFILLMAIAVGVNIFWPAPVNTAQLGIAGFLQTAPLIFTVTHAQLMTGNLGAAIMVATLVFFPSLLLMGFFGSGKAWSHTRLPVWLVVGWLVFCALYVQIMIVLQTAQAESGVQYWWCLALVPDLILLATLMGILRARRYVYKNIGKEIKNIGCVPFERMLKYKE